MPDKKPYSLNLGISAALTTGRSQLLKLVDVSQLSHEDIREILRLLADLIEERQTVRYNRGVNERLIKEHLRTIRAQTDKLEDIYRQEPTDALPPLDDE